MILNREAKQTDVETYGTEESIDMSIDSSDQAALMMILSENLYKDSIGSLIRESASNALDAKKKAGSDQPIIVRLERDHNYNYTYSVTDFGTGIGPEEVKNVLSKYAASTKRGSNEYLGYYGLGFKAPLSYVDSFVFTTRVDGIEYQYLMYKGEKGTKIDLIDSHATSSDGTPNSTTVEVQIKRADIQSFIAKMKEQLAYFEGVYFETMGLPGNSLKNDFKIVRADDWKYSELIQGNKQMHLCLSDVFYEIDWNKLGIPPVNIPIGLNFGLEDGIMPIPSREDIKYTSETKELILAKIKKVANYFMEKFNESRVEAESFAEVWNKFNQTIVTLEGFKFDVSKLQQYADNPHLGQPTVKGIKLLNLEHLSQNIAQMFEEYEIRGRINGGIFQGKYLENSHLHPEPLQVYRKDKYMLAEERPKGVQLEYIKEVHSPTEFIYKTHSRKLGTSDYITWTPHGNNELHTYRQLLKLSNYPKEQWRQVITEFQTVLKSVMDTKVTKIENIQPTQEWLDERKANRKMGERETAGNERLWIKIARKNDRINWDNGGITFEGQMIPKKELGKTIKGLVVYGDKTQIKELQALGILQYTLSKRVKLAIVNKSEQKKLAKFKNFLTVKEFMQGNNKPFKVYATAILIYKFIQENGDMVVATPFLRGLRKQFADDLDNLVTYSHKHYPNHYYGTKTDFMEECLQIAQQYNLFDEEIMIVYERVMNNLPKFKDLDIFAGNFGRSTHQRALSLAREVLRYRGVRMDWENYTENPPIRDDEDEEAEYPNFTIMQKLRPITDGREIDGDPGDEDEDDEEDGLDIDTGIAPVASEASIIPDFEGVDNAPYPVVVEDEI